MESPMKNMAYWKAKNSGSPIKMDNTIQNDLGVQSDVEEGGNSKLIEALKKQDEAKKQVEALKKQTSGDVNTGNNLNTQL